jgi:hypothetical protein
MAAAQYEIVVRGRLGRALIRSFDDLEIRSTDPDQTRLYGWFPDQPALHGVLSRIGDLGLELASVTRLPDEEEH